MAAFCNKVIVVTGATRGIGKATVLRFIAEGAIVAGIYLNNDEAAHQLQAQVNAEGGNFIVYKGSVADRLFVAEVMKDVNRRLGRLDVLVNNAGRTNDQMALFMTEEQWHGVLDVNFVGTCNCAQEVIPYMASQGGGSIVNVVSVSGLHGREGQTNYAASKGAVIGLSKLLARRYASDGIQVNAIAPGLIDTDMAFALSEERRSGFLRHTAAGRLGSAEEIANAIAYLASPLSAYTSGHTLKIDGGFLQ
ncbi:SDR family oxidoreductase [Paenibacillaceae bacterium]|nr:SDR family oxidoreductase [Paenibacillaceae bacterium]